MIIFEIGVFVSLAIIGLYIIFNFANYVVDMLVDGHFDGEDVLVLIYQILGLTLVIFIIVKTPIIFTCLVNNCLHGSLR